MNFNRDDQKTISNQNNNQFKDTTKAIYAPPTSAPPIHMASNVSNTHSTTSAAYPLSSSSNSSNSSVQNTISSKTLYSSDNTFFSNNRKPNVPQQSKQLLHPYGSGPPSSTAKLDYSKYSVPETINKHTNHPASNAVNSNNNNNSRIDPSQMPRPDKPQKGIIYHTRQGLGRKNPPLSNTIFTSIDTGNCSPRYMRPTMVAPPGKKDVLSQIGLPFTVLCTPFASPENNEKIIPEVVLSDLPPRCTRCNAYINLYVQWLDEGNAWSCNICSMKNATPSWYYSTLDVSGLRTDRTHRPELQLGSLDFVVNKDYCIRDIQEPIYVFAIDISEKAIANGTTIAAIRAIQSCLCELRLIEKKYQAMCDQTENDDMKSKGFLPPSQTKYTNSSSSRKSTSSVSLESIFGIRNTSKVDPDQQSSSKIIVPSCRIKASIITFNKEVQFYSINNKSGISDPIKIFVCGDGMDPLAPLPVKQWLHYISHDSDIDDSIISPLDLLLQQLPELIASLSSKNNYETTSEYAIGNQCCVTAAIKAVQEGLEKVGGNLTVITSSTPNHGFGALLNRENISSYGTKEEVNLYGYTKNSGTSLANVTDATAKVIASAKSIMGADSSSKTTAISNKVSIKNQQFLVEYESSCLLYNKLAEECSQSMLCLNVVSCVGGDFLDGGEYVDTTLLGDISLSTGGKLHFFAGSMTREENVDRLEQQLVNDIQQSVASEAVIKLRTSIGIRVESVLGPGVYSAVKNEVECCGIHSQSTFMFTLSHDSSLKEDEKMYLQLAVLHTTINQKRVVRIHNLMLIASNKPTLIFRNSDIEAVVVSLMKIACDKALSLPLNEEKKGARVFLEDSVTGALHKYRINCSPNSPKGQLILPESLKVLPIYTLGMLKHPALLLNVPISGSNLNIINNSSIQSQHYTSNSNRSNATRPLAFTPNYECILSSLTVRAHERAFELRRVLCGTVVEIINSLYPRVYSLLDILQEDEQTEDNSNNVGIKSKNNSNEHIDGLTDSITLPTINDMTMNNPYINSKLLNTLNPTAEVFEKEKLYLVDDRSTLYLYIGRALSPYILESLFNISQSQYGRSDSISIIPSDEFGRKLLSFIKSIQRNSYCKQDMKVIWPDLSSSKPLNNRFSLRLIEDSNNTGLVSYVDYLCNTHSRIQGIS